MRSKRGALVFILAAVSALVTACGGGGGGGTAPTPITVSAAKNPVLVGGSTTITASFANYTSTIKFGSTVNFQISAPGTLSSATTKTQAGGIATVTITSPQAATVTVAANSGNFAGSTTVSFIPLPASATVVVTPQAAISSLGALSCNVKSDVPVTFSSYSTVHLSGTALTAVNPVIGSNNVTLLTTALVSASGVDVTTASPLFKLYFTIPSNALAVPNFTIDQSSIVAALTSTAPVVPTPVLNVLPTYFDGNGKVLFP